MAFPSNVGMARATSAIASSLLKDLNVSDIVGNEIIIDRNKVENAKKYAENAKKYAKR